MFPSLAAGASRTTKHDGYQRRRVMTLSPRCSWQEPHALSSLRVNATAGAWEARDGLTRIQPGSSGVVPRLSSPRHSGDNLARCPHCIHTASIDRCQLQRKIEPVPGADTGKIRRGKGGKCPGRPACTHSRALQVLAPRQAESAASVSVLPHGLNNASPSFARTGMVHRQRDILPRAGVKQQGDSKFHSDRRKRHRFPLSLSNIV